jgi:hypothetical protein
VEGMNMEGMNMEGMYVEGMNVEGRNWKEWMWKEIFIVYFEVLFRYLTGGAEENHENLSQDSWRVVETVPLNLGVGRNVKKKSSIIIKCYPGPPTWRTFVNMVMNHRVP